MHSCGDVLGLSHLGPAAAGLRWPLWHVVFQKQVKASLRTRTRDRALRLRQEALDQDIRGKIRWTHLGVWVAHALPRGTQFGRISV